MQGKEKERKDQNIADTPIKEIQQLRPDLSRMHYFIIK